MIVKEYKPEELKFDETRYIETVIKKKVDELVEKGEKVLVKIKNTNKGTYLTIYTYSKETYRYNAIEVYEI